MTPAVSPARDKSSGVGHIINPTLVEGQFHGGIVQGVREALMGTHRYNAFGQLVSGSFMVYQYGRPRTSVRFTTRIKPMKPLDLPSRPRILVVALRRLGDVLFATSLIASLRGAFRQGVIDVLVFEDTAGILAGNPDIDGIVTMPPRPSVRQGLVLALRLAKRYDLAVSTQSGDRPTIFALVAGRRHVGPIDGGARGRLRRLALTRSVAPQPGSHRLDDMLRLADAVGVARVGHLVCPGRIPPPASARHSVPEGTVDELGAYAVIHAAPMFRYKRWTPDGWRTLAAALRARGVKVVATGGPSVAERTYLDLVWGDVPEVLRRDGQLSWPELAELLGRARLFVGPDTSVTHLAAATGCPTIALFGPTDPRLWGPVPAGGLDPMWEASGTIQRCKNVWLVQHPLPCLPCQHEGCERNIASFSRCLDELQPAQVLCAVEAAFASVSPSPSSSACGRGKKGGGPVDAGTTRGSAAG